jgi:DNA-binding IclR family transcriptional regulator
MDADEALIRAFNLGTDDAGWTEEVMDKAELLLPSLIEAGYAARDDETNTWRLTKTGVARHDEIVIEGPH